MRVVVVGATGNIGSSLVRALLDEPAVDSVVGVARRSPSSSAREELDWHPRHTSLDALDELIDGMAVGRGEPLPPLEPDRPGRVGELATGVGARR